ncbi:MAG: tyrosine-type recombinase/integrase [Nitrospirae bacterium]|nr:tyrosine-type recombinase/integrase [Nitrospirota bacterium]
MGTVYKPQQWKKENGKYIRTGKENKYWWIQYCKDGKVYRESSKSTDFNYAKRLLKVKEGRLAEGRAVDIIATKTRIEYLVELYLKSYEVNHLKSIGRAEQLAELIRKHFGHLRAVDLTTAEMWRYREVRKAQKVMDSTINRELAALRRMLKLGMQEDPPLVVRIPKFPILKEDNVRIGFFELEDFIRLKEKLPNHLKVVATFAFYSGMRAGEILGLRWDQVDLKNGTLRLETGTTKSGEGREIPLIKDLKDTLEWWELETRAAYPWCQWICHYKGQKYQSYKRAWNTATKNAGLTGKMMHDFRRTGVRNLIRAGVPQSVAMAISGHKTDSVFRRYDIVSHTDIVQAGEKLTKYHEAMAAQAHQNRDKQGGSDIAHNIDPA